MDEQVEHGEYAKPDGIWLRGFYMILFAIFFALAETLLGVLALVQFFWMLFKKEKNRAIVDFGRSLGLWMRDVAAFQTGVSDEKPFPWTGWPKAE